MKTQEEIVLETIKWYSTHKRGLDHLGACTYDDGHGNKCAIGRVIDESFDTRDPEFSGYAIDVMRNFMHKDDVTHFDDLLKPEYRGHKMAFWNNLQLLHDSCDFWLFGSNSSANILTDCGKRYVSEKFRIKL